MPRNVVGQFSVEYLQILDTEGNADAQLMPMLSRAQLEKLYYYMVLARTFDQTAIALQREGRLLTYGSIHGQEAAQVPVALAMEKQDWLVPSFREHGAILLHGGSPKQIYMYWGGDERGHAFEDGVNIMPVCVPVGTHIPHAVGLAWAFQKKKEPKVAVAFFGDGATSTGDFHEGLNFASVFKVPAVFVCQNNQWAISMPRSRQTASETIAQKAIAYGMHGIQVDGNDALAMYSAAKEAMDRARAGEGPTLIEAVTYRIEHHTTADDWTRYRDSKEVEEWIKKDPIERFKKFLLKEGVFDEEKDVQLRQKADDEIKRAVAAYEGETPPVAHDMFQHTFGEVTEPLKEQWEYLWKLMQQPQQPAQKPSE